MNEACIVQKNTGSLTILLKKLNYPQTWILYKKYCSMRKHQRDTKLIFGHAAWEKNQLQEEIERGDWLIQEYSDSIFKSSRKIYGMN